MKNREEKKLNGSFCTHKPYVICQPLFFLNCEKQQEEKDSVRETGGKKKKRKMEEQEVASETGREEKLLNDETICTVKRLDQTSTNGRTSSMATGSVTKRKAAISLNTPIFFSPFLSHDPPPFPNYKAQCIYDWVFT